MKEHTLFKIGRIHKKINFCSRQKNFGSMEGMLEHVKSVGASKVCV
jgi:hypothetical protein